MFKKSVLYVSRAVLEDGREMFFVGNSKDSQAIAVYTMDEKGDPIELTPEYVLLSVAHRSGLHEVELPPEKVLFNQEIKMVRSTIGNYRLLLPITESEARIFHKAFTKLKEVIGE